MASKLNLNASPIEKYTAAGQITKQIKVQLESRDWRGESYMKICDFVEGEIRRQGGAPAFPVNICSNESAAHYSPEIEDEKLVAENDLLKIDVGAHIDGYIADTAVSLCYNEELLDLTQATKEGLNEALGEIKMGGKASDVGQAVESYANRRGYLPIENLSGHSLEQYQIHAGSSVPNVWTPSNTIFKVGSFYAIEPFFTMRDGAGFVVEGETSNIFSIIARKRTKEKKLNEFLDIIWNRCKSLPFSPRWFSEFHSKNELERMIGELVRIKLLRSYPELIEARRKPVAQAEHSVAITSTGIVVLT